MREEELVDRARTMVRGGGGRLTRPREQILRTLARLGGHPTAGQIHAALGEEDAPHLSTTYRTLESLCAVGVLSHVHVDHGEPTFHFSAAVSGRPHVHAACSGCGSVVDLPTEVVAPVADYLRDNGYEPHLGHTALSVTCPECARD
ncbi:Transcriptional regulator, FUR family [Serinicoccus hydrothermalis]|uniref:Transcriptional regulator, FUR family n=1 Tax=Serinicoccus hydrothermalis TaxID=1758689 RepID=A0A1B1NB74_9MICO|nr:transcriptional repressor [Serinicoccus hydrothermalis]ANS78688.1 Transcriptional regulator, FUR family [Serinicoccus hydrothermalis]